MTTVVKPREPTATNAELVHGALAGDRGAWEELVRRYHGSLYWVARSFRLDQATSDDVVQTTWPRLIEHLDTLRDPSGVGAWLMTTLRRHIISVLRGRRREPHLLGLDNADVPDPGRSPQDEVTACDRDTRVHAALRRLPVRDRQLLVLLMASPSPNYREVSAELRMPVGSIGPTRARSLDRLRHELDAVGIDSELLGV
jgi:RNA polymerase sigma factor (sigma-70 family)